MGLSLNLVKRGFTCNDKSYANLYVWLHVALFTIKKFEAPRKYKCGFKPLDKKEGKFSYRVNSHTGSPAFRTPHIRTKKEGSGLTSRSGHISILLIAYKQQK